MRGCLLEPSGWPCHRGTLSWGVTAERGGSAASPCVDGAGGRAACPNDPSAAPPRLLTCCSFPSGHTSSVFVLATWAAVYCIWALSMRPSVRRSAAQLARMTLGGRLAHEAGAAAAWLWVLLQLGWAWAVGVSRITDFK